MMDKKSSTIEQSLANEHRSRMHCGEGQVATKCESLLHICKSVCNKSSLLTTTRMYTETACVSRH